MTEATAFSPAGTADDERRDRQRRTVLLKALIYQRGSLFDCVVNNLSSSGAGVIVEVQILRNEIDAEPGSIVTLTIDRFGDFPGKIVWHHAQYAGIRFFEDPEHVAALVEALLPDA
jgi:hypothetical protein